MKTRFFVCLLLFTLTAGAQDRQGYLDYSFKPTQTSPYYFGMTRKTDSGWYREAYYLEQKSLALQGYFKDEDCKVPAGVLTRFYPNRKLQSSGLYKDGKRDGTWLSYSDEGSLIDSATYKNGRRTAAFRWHKNGRLADSLVVDNDGNGSETSWYDDGALRSTGHWLQDTLKQGRWTYYQKNGKVEATEDYEKGKRLSCDCFDEQGGPLDPAACKDQPALPGGGLPAWHRYLEDVLSRLVVQKTNRGKWGTGQHTVLIRFVVNTDGSLSDFVPLTFLGDGTEQEVIALFKEAPRWTPGRYHGRPVRSAHTQPLTFNISEK